MFYNTFFIDLVITCDMINIEAIAILGNLN